MSGERVSPEKIHPPEQDDLFEIDHLEIAPLSDEDLDAVVGGVGPLDSDCVGQDGAGGRATP
jgi:hypothetical protein